MNEREAAEERLANARRGRKRTAIVAILILLLLAGLVLMQRQIVAWQQHTLAAKGSVPGSGAGGSSEDRSHWTTAQLDSARLDSLRRAGQHLADSLRADSLQKAITADSATLAAVRAESLALADSVLRLRGQRGGVDSVKWRLADSAARARAGELTARRIADSLARRDKFRADSLVRGDAALRADSLSRAHRDSTPPEFALDPVGGRYYGSVTVTAKCEEPRCALMFAQGDTSRWAPWAGNLELKTSGKVWAYAQDSAGNRTAALLRAYTLEQGSHQCGRNAVPARSGAREFCIDQYEWPNESGARPQAMVAWQAANDSCAARGKRLCTQEEWRGACRGPENLSYPYGNRYEPRTCITSAKDPDRSGRRANCRSWAGVYDLSGNLWEWTSTPAARAGYYEVAGGSWGSGDHSACAETKYSFFPQNQYPLVGFRCCAAPNGGN
jgi:hypothetical protein